MVKKMNSRELLLKIAYDEIYQNGYQATSVDKILKKANMNKGSMYHFFKSKKELTLAMIEEYVGEYIDTKYGVILETEKNYIDAIMRVFRDKETDNSTLCGCRLHNLVQELSHKDEDFKKALEKIYFKFEKIFEEVFMNAIKKGEIKHSNPKALSLFVVASLEGCMATAKKSQDISHFFPCINELENYLISLK